MANCLATPPFNAERCARALEAAQAVARRYGIRAHQPRVLHDANNIVVHLAPAPVVAKVCAATAGARGWCKLAAELEIARHLVRADAPVVGPSADLPAGPHSEDGFAITFWRHHQHDSDVPVSAGIAGQTLAQVHLALDSYPGEVPSFLDRRLRYTARTLADPAALSGLRAPELAFLRSEYSSLLSRLGECRLGTRALHGDPHRGNLLVSRGEYLMIDFESVCTGPLEWDLSALPGGGAGVFAVDPQLLALLRRLRSLCVAVWCWTRSVRAIELDRAARAHFDLLWERRVA